MDKRILTVLCAMLATTLSISGLYQVPATETEPIAATDMAADPPHNITHFLHTGDTARYISPQLSVLSFFDTNLPSNMTGDGRSYSGQEQFAMQWYMFPPAASNLTMTGIDAIFWITGEVGTGQPNFAGSIEVFEVTEQDILSLNFDGTSVYLYNIPSDTPLFTYPPSAPMVFPLSFVHTFNASGTIRFVLTVNPGASGAGVGSQYTNVTVFWDSYHLFDSRLVLKTQNPMTIDSSATNDFARQPKNGFIDEGNTTMYFSANVSDPYGGYDIRWVNLTVKAPNGTAVPGLDNEPMARVTGSDMAPVSVYELSWDYGGMPTGAYTYDVWAVDNSGMTYYYYFAQLVFQPYDELLTNTLAIGVVYNLQVHLNDSLGAPLVGATVDYDGATALSNDTGWASLTVFGNGMMDVYWHSILAYSSLVNLTEDSILFVTCDVYSPELRLVDSQSQPLPSATAFFEYADGERLPVLMSGIDGSIGVIDQVPTGNSALSAWWRGSLVFDADVVIRSNNVLSVICNVYYMTVHVTDNAGTPIPMSTVVWLDSETHILIDSMFSDEMGVAVARLPEGTYDVEVYWHGNLIGTALDTVLSTDIQITVIGQVCSVNIVAMDSRGIPLSDAHVVVKSASEVIVSRLTNDSGVIHAILPVGTLEVETYWYGVLVNHTLITLDRDANVIVTCSVSYLAVNTEDAAGNTLNGVEIVVKNSEGNAIGYGLTVDGTTMFRLPDQMVAIEGRLVREYMMTHVDLTQSANVNVTGDFQITLTFNYPPGVLSTVLFSLGLVGTIAAVLAALVVFLLLRTRSKSRSGRTDEKTAELKPHAEEEPLPPPFDSEPMPAVVTVQAKMAAERSSSAPRTSTSRRKRKP
jgi:hypothetical protein